MKTHNLSLFHNLTLFLPILYLFLSLSVFHSSLSLPLSLSHTHTHTLFLSVSSLSLSFSVSFFFLSFYFYFLFSPSPSLSPQHAHTLSLFHHLNQSPPSLSLPLSLSLSPQHAHSLSLFHHPNQSPPSPPPPLSLLLFQSIDLISFLQLLIIQPLKIIIQLSLIAYPANFKLSLFSPKSLPNSAPTTPYLCQLSNKIGRNMASWVLHETASDDEEESPFRRHYSQVHLDRIGSNCLSPIFPSNRPVGKLLVFDWNTWNHVCKLFIFALSLFHLHFLSLSLYSLSHIFTLSGCLSLPLSLSLSLWRLICFSLSLFFSLSISHIRTRAYCLTVSFFHYIYRS